jgi:hypothetical protein
MDIKLAQEYKKRLETIFKGALIQFEKDTGLKILYVDVKSADIYKLDLSNRIYDIDITVEI